MIDPTGHEVHGPELEPPEVDDPTVVNEPSDPPETVCDTCFQENLTSNVGIIFCKECKTSICKHYASSIDPQYCVGCLSDVTVEKTNVTWEQEKYSEKTDTVVKIRRRGREIKIEGLGWLFFQRKIYTLSEAELESAIEYHKNILSLMLTEAERLRNNKIHRYAGVKVPTPSTITKTTVTKESTKTVSTKATAQASALLSTMLARGFTLEQLEAIAKLAKK